MLIIIMYVLPNKILKTMLIPKTIFLLNDFNIISKLA